MVFLPVVDRELRAAARRPATYRLRFLLALGAFFTWLLLLVGSAQSPAAQKGRILFIAVGILALAFVLLAGIFLTADCLSEEKREGTLGLLFLTPLRGYDVVLGKLIATSLHAFYGLLGVLPLLALPLLIGGVTIAEFWRVTLVLITTLFFSLAIGLLVSAFSQDARQAISGTLLILLVLAGICPGIWWAVRASGLAAPSWLLWTSPVQMFIRALASFYGGGSGSLEFFTCWCALLVMIGTALLTSSFYLPRSWHQKAEDAGATKNPGRFRRLRFGSEEHRRGRRRLLETNPVYWLATRDRLPQSGTMIAIGALCAVWGCAFAGCFFASTRVRDVCFGIVMFLGYAIHQFLKTYIAIESSRRLSEDKRSGALELLLVSPLRIEQITGGIRAALAATFAIPAALALFLNVLLLWLVLGPNPFHVAAEDQPVFFEMYMGGIVVLAFDAYALAWTGQAMALRKRKHQRATMATLGRIMLLPWLGILLFIFIGNMGGPAWGSGEVFGVIFVWFFGCAIFDALAAGHARITVARELRNSSYNIASAKAREHAFTLQGAFEPGGVFKR